MHFIISKYTTLAVLLAMFFSYGVALASNSFDISDSEYCSRYFKPYESTFQMPQNLLRAISVTESGRWFKSVNKSVAWPWTINVQGKGYYYPSKREAISAVEAFQAKGIESIDVGCMQINLKYHPNAFTNLEQAFEPRYNVGYAAVFLKRNYDRFNNWKTAVKRYHNSDPRLGKRYISRVFETWKTQVDSFELALDSNHLRYIPQISVKPYTSEPSKTPLSDITRNALSVFSN